MKEEIQYEKWIKQMYEKYKSILFIEKYHFKVEKGTNTEYLESVFSYPYLDTTIKWSNESLKDWKKNKVDAERNIIHELCHTITDQFYQCANNYPSKERLNDERERMTDHIAQIIHKHLTKND